VPVLKQESTGLALPDSDVIVEVLEKEHPNPSMKSDAPSDLGSKLFPAFRAYLSSHAGEADEADKKAALEEQLRLLEAELKKPGVGPLFGGETLNATDASVGPKLYHCKVALKHFKNFDFPSDLTAISDYLNTIGQQAAWKATDYGEAMIISGWAKHLSH
jgi:glutathione S-transferase